MQGLLFYDPTVGEGEFYTTDVRGGIVHLRTFTDWRGTWSQIAPGEFARESLCMVVHFKTLVPLTRAVQSYIDAQYVDMFQLFARSGVTVLRGPDEDLSGNPALAALQNLDVGDCRGVTTQDQRDLYANRNGVGRNGVVVFVVATLISPRGNLVAGCGPAAGSGLWDAGCGARSLVRKALGAEPCPETGLLVERVCHARHDVPPGVHRADALQVDDASGVELGLALCQHISQGRLACGCRRD
jgi:hypothetical protein